MKINNKGFLLMETIVTVCIIATLATSAYLYVSKTASRFEERTNYENVVDVYKVNTLKQYLEEKTEVFKTGLGSDNYIQISDTNLGSLKTDLKIEKAYLIINKVEGKNSISTTNKALKDYIKWLKVDGDSNLRLIVWFKGENGEDGTFANMKISIVTS